MEFFPNGRLLGGWNASAVTLIPKIQVPNTMRDFRPVSCCNVVYKCIAKVLVGRLKPVLNDLVGVQQSAFIPGRHIAENILLMQELMRGHHRDNGEPRCAVKIDIQKAYDSVGWGFLKEVLVAMNFPHIMIEWVMECVTTTAYSISMNGCLEGYFKGAKGLRQGEFLLIMEAFSHVLNSYTQQQGYQYHKDCEEVGITHLIFVDDLFILSAASTESLSLVKRAMTEFGELSALHPNYQKCIIFVTGVSEEVKSELCNVMRMELKQSDT